MGEAQYGNATSEEVRRAIQNSTNSIRNLARSYGINPKTVAKWKKRSSPYDCKIDRSMACSKSLTIEEENMVISFRRHSMLPLDDCLYALQISIPHLTRSSLHRCLQRNAISRIPGIDLGESAERQSVPRQIGTFLISLTELRTAQGNLYLYAATDRLSKFTVAHMVQQPGDAAAVAFLDLLVANIPYKIRTALTSNHVQSTFPIRYSKAAVEHFSTSSFKRRCEDHGIDHQIYQVQESWLTSHSFGAMPSRESVNHFAYDSSQDLEPYIANFLLSFNYNRRLKCLRGLTPYRFICKIWETHPHLFLIDPYHPSVGPIRNGKMTIDHAIR